MTRLYATEGHKPYLPRPSPTEGQMYSVPRLDGLYDYYLGPPGSTPPRNDDYPLPSFAHPNPIGVSSLSVGRPLHPKARKVGTGEHAIGSVTAMPGAALPLSMGGSMSGLGEALSGSGSSAIGLVAFALAAACGYLLVERWRRMGVFSSEVRYP